MIRKTKESRSFTGVRPVPVIHWALEEWKLTLRPKAEIWLRSKGRAAKRLLTVPGGKLLRVAKD